MTDNKIFRGHKDRSRIDVNDPNDVAYAHYQFPWLSHKEIRDIIRQHGPDRGAVEAALERAGKSGDDN